PSGQRSWVQVPALGAARNSSAVTCLTVPSWRSTQPPSVSAFFVYATTFVPPATYPVPHRYTISPLRTAGPPTGVSGSTRSRSPGPAAASLPAGSRPPGARHSSRPPTPSRAPFPPPPTPPTLEPPHPASSTRPVPQAINHTVRPIGVPPRNEKPRASGRPGQE